MSKDNEKGVYVHEYGRSSPDSEENQPFEDVKITKVFNPFPEAVVVDPVLAGRRESAVPTKERRRSSIAEGEVVGTFGNASDNAIYRPIASYEGIHRYDPEFAWEAKDEKRLVRKIDWKICTWVCLMFFALQLDRGNIVQALSDGMLGNLKMTSNNYNYGQMIFYVSFLAAELPSQLISKKLGPDNWIPIQMVSWSLVASLQCLIKDKTGFYICRCLLGIIEGGFIPDVILYLSYFYTSVELPTRLSFFWVAYQSTNIVSAFLAYGILRLGGPVVHETVGTGAHKLKFSYDTPGHQGLYGWQWLFALEGTLTGIIGIISYFYLPPSPYQTASKFRGKDGWFTVHEEKIIANRILRDDPSKGDMHNRQGLSPSALWACLKDYHMWPIYLIGISWLIPTVPMQGYITLNLTEVGFGTFETNLLTIPAYTLFIVSLLWWTWLSEKLNERFLLATVSQIWVIAPLIGLVVLGPGRSPWVDYALSVLVFGIPYFHAVFVAITSRNAGSVRTRTVASALYNMTVQAGNVIGINIYRTDDAPYYYTGNKVLIGIACWNILVMVGTKIFYVRTNRKRAAIWDAMDKQQREEYLNTTTDKGNKRLDFRFAH
ncbi:major facilitator superfamily domain-containing protein [Neohortaea acidophila]|uniref:Major facilitator superfamily domain-containing protein n=1 Tax=Neohortaea acidophila TaxID=245834 RepID=A0A6A6Q3D8_9PEZI|nr:major facilitator superfamily domain-containing protein [Neohortaea acidophila]KAF2486466.1 major facilitator superfamily domain-containing protein [Neohortaea acidophila]